MNFHRLAGTKKNLLIIHSKIYSVFSSELAPHESVAANVERLWFTFYRLGGTGFFWSALISFFHVLPVGIAVYEIDANE